MTHPIKYFSFWDVPRTFVFERDGQLYLLTSEFDDDIDEYPDEYEIFLVPGHRFSAVTEWNSMAQQPRTPLGRVSVSRVSFDSTLRKFVDDSFLDTIVPMNES